MKHLAWLGVGLCLAIAACEPSAPLLPGGPVSDWPEYGAQKGGGRYSPLTQITRDNVRHLEIAWEYHTGDFNLAALGMANPSLQTTPIMLEGTLYLCSARNRLIALDAETGDEKWIWDANPNVEGIWTITCRGVSSWFDAERKAGELCQHRLFMGTLDARLVSLDAASGRPCPDFGRNGEIDLSEGIGDVRPGEYGVTSPPLVIDDVVVTGTLVMDNLRRDAPGGVVRAFDLRSGKLRWDWDPVPPGWSPPSEAEDADVRYARGTTNAWSILSGDPELNHIYIPTGNTSPDYFGGLRNGFDHYSSSIVALDARTGEVVWHFQTVHHDVWDYDVPSQPTLFDWTAADGSSIPALAQTTKMGHVFLLDRRNGKSLFPIEERAVPQGAETGEILSPTQPFPTRPGPLHPHRLEPNQAFGFTPWDRADCRRQIEALRNDGIFTPPTLQGSLNYPNFAGGQNWGSPAIDPKRQLLVVNTNRVAAAVQLIPRNEADAMLARGELVEPMAGTPYGFRRWPLLSPFGAPCSPPPWGTLAAIDLLHGEIVWEVPLGTTRDTAPFPLWFDIGVPNIGGPIMTASGLTFIAATTDNYLRAFDSESGRELWKGRLPAGGQATPMTYRAREAARQYVVIAAGGHGVFQTTPGDSIVAFALPESD